MSALDVINPVKDLAFANMKARYRKTYAGFLWVIINPLMMYGVQSFVFKVVLKIQVENYLFFLLGGLLPWIFIVSSMGVGTCLFESKGRLIKSFKMNPFILLYAMIVDNIISFMAALFLVLTPLILVFGSPLDGLIYFPLALINILLGTIGIVSILATSQVFFRDTKFIVPFFTSIMFFLTPIFYPRNFVPSGFQWAVDMNPLYGLINPMRMCIFEFNREAFFFELGKGVMWSTLFVILAIVVWRSKKNEFYLQL